MSTVLDDLLGGVEISGLGLGGSPLAEREFTARVLSEGLVWTHLKAERVHAQRGWRNLLPSHFIVHRALEGERRAVIYAESADGVVLVKLEVGVLWAFGASADRARAEALTNEIVERFRPYRPAENLPVYTWWRAGHGPQNHNTYLEVQGWSDIRRNYARRTAVALDQVMSTVRPRERGRLLLWHGEPGTGKSRAIGALGRAWQEWCDVHLVIDPDRLFEDPGYLLSLTSPGRDPDDDQRWRLVVAEDADDYLRSDARQTSRGAIGRLLNSTDGLFSHLSRVIVLLTTNEHVDLIDPALTRPGRTLATIEFGRLTPDEAAEWLPEGSRRPSGPVTIAELYQNGGMYL